MKPSPNQHLHPKYRPDIDGLRAIAVLTVVLFHGFPEWITGGFIGVDIFFVISGYLITEILLRNLNQGSFSFTRFYARRIIRIFPSLIIVLIACLVFGWFRLLAEEYTMLGKETVAAASFLSNFYFWYESGYFSTVSFAKPLLHLWSLGIEEQFYIVWPLLLWLAWKIKFNFLLVIVFFGITSFILNVLEVSQDSVAAFFSPQTRFWELATGSALAWHTLYGKRLLPIKIRSYWIQFKRNKNSMGPQILRVTLNVASFSGLLLLTYGFFYINETDIFPGWWSLVPVLGAAMIIAAGSGTWVNHLFLSNKILVWIGLISYPLYLWHWPILFFTRNIEGSELSINTRLIAVITSILLAWLTYKIIEQPLRTRKFSNNIAILLLLIMGAIGCAGYIIYSREGLPLRAFNQSFIKYTNSFKWTSFGKKLDSEGYVCTPMLNEHYKGVKTCEFGAVNSKETIVIYGDSHSQAISRVLDKKMAEIGFRVVRAEIDCRIIFDITSDPGNEPKNYYDRCNSNFNELKRFIRDNNADTLMVTRWTFQFFPMPGYVEELPFDNHAGGVEADLAYRKNVAILSDGSTSLGAAAKKNATLKVIEGLAGASKNLYLSYPIPEIGWNIFQHNKEYISKNRRVLNVMSYSYDRYLERNRFILDILDAKNKDSKNIIFLRPDKIFCESILPNRCVAQYNGIPYYYDDDHLSDSGASLLVDEFSQKLKKNNLFIK